MSLTPEQIASFQHTVLKYYQHQGRGYLPWRTPEPDGSFDPYKILVSEVMLQQTQAVRVIPKYQDFITRFETPAALAAAPLAAVLTAWSGLGYNRRAKFLWQAAGKVVAEHGGRLPDNLGGLVALPGVGANTAGAVLAYAFNKPVVFIETNIRTVFIHHFFAGEAQVHDRLIADLVAATLPDDARTWYWALMDYGTYLKQTAGNAARRSAHYTRQTAFQGSRRQVRGAVLRALAAGPQRAVNLAEGIADERLPEVLDDLVNEGLIAKRSGWYALYGA